MIFEFLLNVASQKSYFYCDFAGNRLAIRVSMQHRIKKSNLTSVSHKTLA